MKKATPSVGNGGRPGRSELGVSDAHCLMREFVVEGDFSCEFLGFVRVKIGTHVLSPALKTHIAREDDLTDREHDREIEHREHAERGEIPRVHIVHVRESDAHNEAREGDGNKDKEQRNKVTTPEPLLDSGPGNIFHRG